LQGWQAQSPVEKLQWLIIIYWKVVAITVKKHTRWQQLPNNKETNKLQKNNINGNENGLYKNIFMSHYNSTKLNTQNELLMKSLMDFYTNREYLSKMMKIINGESKISLRIVDWFVTNYAKKYYTVYDLGTKQSIRFKVYNDYKLKLKAYSKKRFDPFCRWERITIPYDNENYMETTIGQLNFFKWAIENNIIEYINEHYTEIENDMNTRNSTSKRKTIENTNNLEDITNIGGKTRKKREELSISACKCIKKESVKIIVKFN
jgi:hypothetical protein